MYQQVDKLEAMTLLNQAKKQQIILHKLQIIKGFAKNIFSGYGNLAYIRISLREISLQKELFVLQMLQGQEVFIPERLALHRQSIYFQFYDPIFRIID